MRKERDIGKSVEGYGFVSALMALAILAIVGYFGVVSETTEYAFWAVLLVLGLLIYRIRKQQPRGHKIATRQRRVSRVASSVPAAGAVYFGSEFGVQEQMSGILGLVLLLLVCHMLYKAFKEQPQSESV